MKVHLGAYRTGADRWKTFHDNILNVFITMDYTEGLEQRYNKQTSSTHFGDNPTVSIEGYAIYFYSTKEGDSPNVEKGEMVYIDPDNPDGEPKIKFKEKHYYGFLSDDKRQDARTTFANLKCLVEWLHEQGKLAPGCTLYIKSEGCGKQYRCGNTLALFSMLACAYKIKIHLLIQCPYHGKSEVDALTGRDKNYIHVFFLRNAPPGFALLSDEEKMLRAKLIEACQVRDGKVCSCADKCCACLSDKCRQFGSKSLYENSTSRG